MKAIEDRLKELATTDSLRAVVSLGKTKASLEANKKLLKIANQEELSALKIKIEDQIEKEQETITNIEDKLKKYSKDADAKDSESTSKEKDSESTSKEKDSETNTGNSKQSKIKKDKTDSKDDSTGNGSSKEDSIKDDSTEDGSSKEFSKGQLKALKQIERYKKAIQDLIDNAKEDKVNVKDNAKRAQDAEEKLINVKKSGNEEEIKKAQDELTDARDGLDAAQRRKQEAENTIDNNRKEINKLIKDNDLDPKLKESFNELYNSYLLIINEGLDNSVNNTSENSNSKIELSNDIAAKFREAMKRLK
jgi:chromosome segregation ATPase